MNWYAIASSSEGNKLAAVVNNGGIYTSGDRGVTWFQQTSAPSKNWYAIASSADGTTLAAVVDGGGIYTSRDSGITWVQQTSAPTKNWYSIASSSDGYKLAAVVYASNGRIYVGQSEPEYLDLSDIFQATL